ncbi:MAG TPA: NAD-dependent epimerase/dehydratase family protein [Pyrinomonadaceae bacterium]|jgi:nucleoside-diphosphate-sugar epimerase
MKVLVTGAGGFIGKAVVKRLKNDFKDIELYQILNRRAPQPENVSGKKESEKKETAKKETEKKESAEEKINSNEKLRIFEIDITDDKQVSELEKICGIDAVVHSAGLAHQFGKVKASDFFSVNVEGAKNVLKLGERLKIKHFILISSVSVYGNAKQFQTGTEGITEESDCAPEDAYAESKLHAESLARQICARAGINLTILRPATVIGEGDKGNFLRLIKTIDKKRFFWIGKGTNYKSLIHCEDVAAAVSILLKEKKNKTEIFNVSAESLRMNEIVEAICETLGKGVSRLSINRRVLAPVFLINSVLLKSKKIGKAQKTVEKWLADDVYSNQKLKDKYEFEPEIKVREAIRREVRWYLSEKS